ncbi:hypothetical protein HNQ91_002018 [Filimonas zeae]|uniref:Uncharacterized protein n=1 Tax=Filimonas zeae TaxID=1737353 RepID=A0A917MUZ3_9BACT|nr:hypothetical protein [Filimonas zeae]MDR6338967.1 hypothetical protein [Filimonas zeae]GGH65736.1 hypothetical protein GCM10011379_19190 [Filimonas zeae]
MLNNFPNSSAAFIEKVENSFNTVTRCVYEKNATNALQELAQGCNELLQLAEEHPNHPAITALFQEYIPYVVCSLDFLTKQAERAVAEPTVVNAKLQQVLQLYDTLGAGWLKAHMPPDCKLPEAFVTRERPLMACAYKAIENSFTTLAFTLPVAMALEVALVLIQAPAGQVITYSQWQYAQQLITHLQQLLNNQITPATEEHVITTLLALRCNTGQFSIWYTRHIKNTIQEAGTLTEKKSA